MGKQLVGVRGDPGGVATGKRTWGRGRDPTSDGVLWGLPEQWKKRKNNNNSTWGCALLSHMGGGGLVDVEGMGSGFQPAQVP